MVLSKDELLAAGSGSDLLEVEIPGVGSVMVRCINRAQANLVADAKTSAEREVKIIAFGLAEPTMTQAEVRAWFDTVPAGYVTPLADAIARHSGLLEGAEKEEVERFPG